MSDFIEQEYKYSAEGIDRLKFKALMRKMNPKKFLYVESTDVYYTKNEEEFLRYRMPAIDSTDKRSELTFKKKHGTKNNYVRTEVNLRIDENKPETVIAFCEGIGYKRNFSIYKICEIYFFEKVDIVFYSVIDENDKVEHFIEIEVLEELGLKPEEGWLALVQAEGDLSPLGIIPQKRMKLSLFERYRKNLK